MSLNLRVHEGPKDMGGEGKVHVDQLRFLMQAVQREVVAKLHGLDHILLLQGEDRAPYAPGPAEAGKRGLRPTYTGCMSPGSASSA